jgi:hypothetical protein
MPDRDRKCRMRGQIHGFVNDYGAGWIMVNKFVALPVPRRSDGHWNKAAATFRSDVTRDLIDARGAEGTFIAAGACIGQIGRQGLVAMLACGSEYEHDPPRLE